MNADFTDRAVPPVKKGYCCFLVAAALLLQFTGCATMGPSLHKADGFYDDKNPGGWAVYKVREDSLRVDNSNYIEEVDRDFFYTKSSELLVKTRYIASMHNDTAIAKIGAKADSLRWKKENPVIEAVGGFLLGFIIGGSIGGAIGHEPDSKDNYVGDVGGAVGYVIGGTIGGLALASRFVYRSRMPNPSRQDKQTLCTLVEQYNAAYDGHLRVLQYPLIQFPRGQRLRKADFISKLTEVHDKSQRYLPETDSFRLQVEQLITVLKNQDSLNFSEASTRNWENEEPPAGRVSKVIKLIEQYHAAISSYPSLNRPSETPHILDTTN
jgi:hypothetical protein